MAVVLVVDDDPLKRNILKVILSDEGYETHVASSGEEALKVARSLEHKNCQKLLFNLRGNYE